MSAPAGFVVVGAFTTPFEAEIARGRLADAEIPAVVLDAGIVTVDWTMSVAVGGVKVAVPEANAEAARALLDAPADADESESGSFEPPTEAEDLSWRALVSTALGSLFPPVYLYAVALLLRYRHADGKTPRTRRRVLWTFVLGAPVVALWAVIAHNWLGGL